MSRPRVLVVGGGITGLTVAYELSRHGPSDSTSRHSTSHDSTRHGFFQVTVREATDRLGGKIRTTPFAGLDAVDEGPDAFLARTPEAQRLAEQLGLGNALTSPTSASAAVWHRGLHPIPDGLVLGVPAGVLPLARSRLLSTRGKLRAALEPLLPRTSIDDDAIGPLVRARFGDEVHERLVDALVGSIYAADTDRFSLATVPQLAALARDHRSLLIGGRRVRRGNAGSTGASPGPLFAAPTGGIGALIDALGEAIVEAGVDVRTSSPITSIERASSGTAPGNSVPGSSMPGNTAPGSSASDNSAPGSSMRGSSVPGGFVVDGETYDHVVLASPARATSPLLTAVAPEAASLLGRLDHAHVTLVTLAIPADEWPERLAGRSGYLVPKPVQRTVTAVSFGSQKWAHWRPADGSQVLRVSLGRDGLDVGDFDDDAVLDAVTTEVGAHLDLDLQPTATRISRWADAFPQYRPHHVSWVGQVEQALPPGIWVAGASYHGIGIPACIRSARTVAGNLSALHAL